jgi:RNA polymerase sigma-70 factor, ECF subfamily
VNRFKIQAFPEEFHMARVLGDAAVAKGAVDTHYVTAINEMTALINERQAYFQRIARRRLNNVTDAEDAVQDAFLSAWRHLDKFKARSRMSTWMTVVVMNSARMVARKRSRHVCLPLESQDGSGETYPLSETVPDSRPDPESETRRSELEYRLRRLMTHLAPNLRLVVQMCGIEGRTARETADALGLTVTAVKSRALRARRELRRLDQVNPASVTGAGKRRPLRTSRTG